MGQLANYSRVTNLIKSESKPGGSPEQEDPVKEETTEDYDDIDSSSEEPYGDVYDYGMMEIKLEVEADHGSHDEFENSPDSPPKRRKAKINRSSDELDQCDVKGVKAKSGKFMPKDYKYNADFCLVDETTFHSMAKNREPRTCPRCKVSYARMTRLIKHWQSRTCLSTHPNGQEYVGIRRNEEETPNYNKDYGKNVYFCTHKLCSSTDQVWKNRIHVLRHWQDAHFDDATEYTACKVEGCGLKYVAAALLYNHMANKHKDDPCSCSFCGRIFKRLSQMRTHEKTHSTEKTICCDYCDYRTNVQAHLTKHKKTRHPEEIGLVNKLELPCEICGKCFKSAYKLKEHKYSHNSTNDPEFQCKVCGKFLKQKNSYSKHMMNVHKIGHTCSLCQKIFYSQKMLQIHRRDRHQLSDTIL